MKRKKLLFLFMCLCVLTGLRSQDTEFWFVAPQSGIQTLNNGGFVFTNTSTNSPARVTITYYKSGLSETINIGPGQGARRIIDRTFSTANVENMMINAGNVVPCGIHIESTEKLVAYYMFDASATKDIFTLKGKAALGTEFFVPQTTDGFYINGDPGTGNNYPNAFDQIDIVATEDNTTVTVTLTRDCVKEYNTATGNGTADISAGTYTVTLPHKGDVIKYLEKGHGPANAFNTLGGTKIVSDKPIAVSSTEEVTNHDMVADQIVPVDKTGTLYPIVKAYSDSTLGSWGTQYSRDRVYIMATEDGTDVFVNLPDGSQRQIGAGLQAGKAAAFNMGELHKPPYAVSIKTNKRAYCLQTTSQSYHPGGAVLPSIYSVAASKLSFYQFPAPLANEKNAIFLAYRDTCEKYFEIEYGGVTYNLMTLAGIPSTGATADQMGQIPGIAGWSYMRVTLPVAADNQVVTISNSESVFSLGYFSGSLTQHYATLGYLSAFGDWKFDPDTIYRCAASARPVNLLGGYAANYKWTLPDGSIRQGADLSILKARVPGMYILEMDQEFQTLTDTCWVLDLEWNASIKRQPNKPAKIGVPQQFSIKMNQSMLNMPTLRIKWTFEGGTPSTSVAASPKVVWNSTGQKKVTLHLSATAGTGAYEVTCDTTLVMDLMLHEKHLGYFVDRNVRGGRRDGTNWPNAFPTIDEALGLASQGDCIWVAEGNYMPPQGQSYVIDYDSVEIYGGFGAWETDLNERNYTLHKTIMNGNGSNVVVFDGSTNYTNGSCGVSRDARVDGFIIRGGEAADGGGILFKNGASGTVANSIITSNTATNLGGGIHISGGYNGGCMGRTGDALIYNTEISHSRATTAGGGIYNSGSAFLSVNNTVSGNIAPTAGGLYNNGGDPHLRNSILWGNLTGGALGSDVMNEGGTPVWSHCNVGGWSATLGKDGGRNIDRNPVFRRKGYDDDLTPRSDGNYRLSSTSPSVNSGYNPFVLSGFRNRTSTVLLHPAKAGYTEALGLDLGSLARIYDDIVDMGAYEYHPNTISPNVVHEIVIGTYPNVTTVPGAGIHYIESQKDFTMTLTPAEGYSLKYIQVKTDSKTRDEQQGGIRITHNEDGTVTLVFPKVVEPLTIQLTGVSPVSNVSIDRGYALRTEEGALHIRTAKATDAQIYSVTGQLVHRTQIARGETSIPLAKGVYIVTLDGQIRQKVVIR